VPNELNPPKKDEKAPDAAELAAQLAAERGRREQLEVDSQRMAQTFASFGRPQPPQPQWRDPGPDPFQVLTRKEDLKPDEYQALLTQGVNDRINQAVGGALDQFGRALGQQITQREVTAAYDRAMMANPDVATDQKGYIAAASAIEYDLRQKGYTATPDQFQGLVIKQYREMFNKPAPPPPYFEGSSPTAMGRGNPDLKAEDLPAEGSKIEELYNLPKGSVTLMKGDSKVIDKVTKDYLKEKNARLRKGGFNTNIGQIRREMRMADTEDAAAAAGGK
jgi:hypothetical protein